MEPFRRAVFHYVDHRGRDLFQLWMDSLKDVTGRAAILKRIDRLTMGLFGDHRYLGKGVWELRIDHGPGYRVYYGEHDHHVVLLLIGGSKRSQVADIHQAQTHWADYRRLA